MTPHAGLGIERWRTFSRDQQVLMIANEMNRGFPQLESGAHDRVKRTYERVLALVDLTIEAQPAWSFRREMLRWRGLVAALYVAPAADRDAHRAAMRVLLRFTAAASRQIALLPGLRD